MSDNEKDIQDLIKNYTLQQQSMTPNPAFTGNPTQGIDPHRGIDNQGHIDESVPISPSSINVASGPSPVPTGNVCSQCNMMHPPLRPGEKCPNATVQAMKTDDDKEQIVDVNKFLVSLQNILMSQIDQKKIKDIKKLYQNITIEITKYLEGYKE